MLEDVSNILNLGEVPNLFSKKIKPPETTKLEPKTMDELMGLARPALKKK